MTDLILRPVAPLALPGEPKDPRAAYLRSLSTEKSRQSMAGALSRVTTRYYKCRPEDFDWTLLDFEQMDALRTKLSEDFNVRTARHALSALRGVLRYAVRLHCIPREQYAEAVDLEPVKGFENDAGRALTASEKARIRAYCEAASGAYGALLVGLLLGVLLGGGLRAAEATNLQLSSYRDGKLTVPGKGLKIRKVPLSAGGRNDLERWLKVRATLGISISSLFVRVAADNTVVARPLSRWNVWKMVETVCAGLEIEASPHDFRRTFLTEYLRRSGDVLAVQRLAGHSKPETTAKYDKRTEDELAQFVERFGDA